jgi:hypothetical protein
MPTIGGCLVQSRKLRQVLIVIAVLGMIIVNGLANALPINGQTTGEVSDRFDIYFVPAAYVFSIWGLIYVGLAALAIYQALPAHRDSQRLQRAALPFLASCLANAAWIFFWHFELFALTIVAMLVLLTSLISVYLRLGVGREGVSRAEAWLVRLPISIYLGWITVATVANVTQYLAYTGWNGWGIAPETWAILMLAAGCILTAAMAVTRRDIGYGLVVVWAFIGIAVEHAVAASVSIAAWIAAALAALCVVYAGVRRLSAR